jgi:hypothetical protein
LDEEIGCGAGVGVEVGNAVFVGVEEGAAVIVTEADGVLEIGAVSSVAGAHAERQHASNVRNRKVALASLIGGLLSTALPGVTELITIHWRYATNSTCTD